MINWWIFLKPVAKNSSSPELRCAAACRRPPNLCLAFPSEGSDWVEDHREVNHIDWLHKIGLTTSIFAWFSCTIILSKLVSQNFSLTILLDILGLNGLVSEPLVLGLDQNHVTLIITLMKYCIFIQKKFHIKNQDSKLEKLVIRAVNLKGAKIRISRFLL